MVRLLLLLLYSGRWKAAEEEGDSETHGKRDLEQELETASFRQLRAE